MEYMNDLRRKDPQDHDRLAEHQESTAMIPDSLTLRWWQLFRAVSVGNIVLWSLAAWGLVQESDVYQSTQLALSGFFVAACAFRSVLPRIDLERMCLWDVPPHLLLFTYSSYFRHITFTFGLVASFKH
jgi:hypothetical protein